MTARLAGLVLAGLCAQVSPAQTTAGAGGNQRGTDSRSAGGLQRVVGVAPPGGQLVQQAKLVGSGATNPASQGTAVAISADGNTVLVGGPSDEFCCLDPTFGAKGAVWAFTRSNGQWAQQGEKMVGSESRDVESQGSSVALSADGNRALVGGPYNAVWVFTRANGGWTQEGSKLVASGAVGEARVGSSVALSADGNTALVGGSFDDGWAGAAWVFTRGGGVWSQQGSKLVGSGATADPAAGTSVALSADGNTALVGGSEDNGDIGAVWVFTRSNGVWTQDGSKLVASGAVGNAELGHSVALSADSSTAVVGGPFDNGSVGAAWVFVRQAAPSSLQAGFTFAPSSPVVGQVVQFTDTSTGSPTSWSWSFGDGTFSTGQNPSHTFASTGTYAVTLTVSDGQTSNTTSQQVTVLNTPPGTGPFELRLNNVDDHFKAYLSNSKIPAGSPALVASADYLGDTGLVDLSPWVAAGVNTLDLQLTDDGGGWTYGYELRDNGTVIASGACGTAGSAGCTDPPGSAGSLVFEKTIQFNSLHDGSCYPPTILGKPQSVTITSGQTATLNVFAGGIGTLSYRWYVGSSGNVSSPVAGATSDTFTTPALTATTSYWVRVTNACGHADSETATVTVTSGCTGGYNLMIPAAAHAPGVNQTMWQTDVDLLNLGQTAALADIARLLKNQGNPSPLVASVVVPPGENLRLADILGAMLPADNAALGIRFCSGAPFVNARFYTTSSARGGTYGMYVPAQAPAEAVPQGRLGVFQHLTHSPNVAVGFRVNVGFANGSPFSVRVVVRLYGDGGVYLGSRTHTLAPFEHFQFTNIYASILAPAVAHGYATLEVTTSGGLVYSYAMLIDNLSGDPIYMPAKLLEAGWCTYDLSPASSSHGAGAEAGSFGVIAPTGCAWTASTATPWVHLAAPASGSGSGTVAYTIDASTTVLERSGTITVAGRTFTITQAGAPCSYSLSPTSRSDGAGAETGSFDVIAPSGCAWTATSNAAWLVITAGASGSGNGPVAYAVDASSDASPRTATITVEGQTFTVTQATAAAQEITITLPGGVEMVLVDIPAGTFTMGSPDSERGRDSDEGPQHQVTITQDYYLGKTEVTQAQWQAVMGEEMPADCDMDSVGPDYPVYCVSWNDIAGTGGFIERLNQLQGTTKFRLPSEAEWEYAARAGTTTEFSFAVPANWDTWCGTFPEAAGYMWWCGNNTPDGSKPVGQKLANPWGLLDMHGNVWEWVQDWYHETYTGAPTDGSAWEVPAGSNRVLRGGGWGGGAGDCRSAYRDYYGPGSRYGYLGFRLARSQ